MRQQTDESAGANLVYVLLNKPKNVITTTDDDRGRPTVIDIVDSSFSRRIFPVGRLNRDTTGLVLLTNDGELAQKLTHPRICGTETISSNRLTSRPHTSGFGTH
ncbi:MAG: hypothetical protein IPH31_23065 [Lewinellaceae bacterium]|nr:hypothetical protein [Lewinellaceae bacterium]